MRAGAPVWPPTTFFFITTSGGARCILSALLHEIADELEQGVHMDGFRNGRVGPGGDPFAGQQRKRCKYNNGGRMVQLARGVDHIVTGRIGLFLSVRRI